MRINPLFGLFVLLAGPIAAWSAQFEFGDVPGEKPPKIAERVANSEENRRLFVWDRPSAFAKVPQDKQALGDFICAKGRIDLYATGYHPGALDKDDKPIPGGGYYCEKKQNGDKPHAQPPRIARKEGIAGWDRPSAFGAVPKALIETGNKSCRAVGSSLEAIGFHPEAQDEQGRPVNGGGYLCGPQLKS